MASPINKGPGIPMGSHDPTQKGSHFPTGMYASVLGCAKIKKLHVIRTRSSPESLALTRS